MKNLWRKLPKILPLNSSVRSFCRMMTNIYVPIFELPFQQLFWQPIINNWFFRNLSRSTCHKTVEFLYSSSLITMDLNFLFIFFASIFVEAISLRLSLARNSFKFQLWVNTTYQAEDLGIRCGKLPQCEAWNLWWKLQVGWQITYMWTISKKEKKKLIKK